MALRRGNPLWLPHFKIHENLCFFQANVRGANIGLKNFWQPQVATWGYDLATLVTAFHIQPLRGCAF